MPPVPLRLAAAAILGFAGLALAAPPPFTVTSTVRSGNLVPGVGQVGSAVAFGAGQGRGILKVAVNNSGVWLLTIHAVQTDTNFDEAFLRSSTGLTPYLAEGIPGYLAVPSTDYVASGLHSLALNNAGSAALAVGLYPDDFSFTNPTSGAYFNTASLAAFEGAALTAPDLAPGTTWARFDADSLVRLTDTGRMLIVSRIVEAAVTKRAVLVAQLDGAGAVTGFTLIAKEGGPVGAGPDTWASIAAGGHAAAINNAGVVAFSGTTTGGTNGVYKSGTGFTAVTGGPTPVAGTVWGALAGAPVDINNNGQIAFRGLLGTTGSFYTESVTDAGEDIDTADRTFGNGPLTRISGTLTNDTDVDMYRIRVSDPATFSATTVPDPGNGFAGAAFDTVLTLISSPENGTRGVVQADNVSGSNLQSTLTAPGVVAGREFYICVSTPKSRCQARIWQYSTNTFPDGEIWASDPLGLAVSGGLIYWPDPSLNQISRSTTAGGVQTPLTAPAIATQITVDSSGGKVYWIDRGASGAPEKIRRANLDGTNIEDLVTASAFGSLAAYWGSGLAVDAAAGKLYWSRAIAGEINRCNLDGSGAERIIQDYLPRDDFLYPPVPGGLPVGNFAPTSLSVDHAGGKIYFVNTKLNRIQRSNLDGTSRASLSGSAGTGAVQLALDLTAGKLYWTNTTANKIQRSNLDGTSIEDVLSTPSPVAISLDVAGGFVYWTNTIDRVVRRATLAGTGAADVIALGVETGQRAPDGEGESDVFFEWTRTGAAGAGPLPYQVKLTGATFRHESVMIAAGSSKVVAVGDAIPGTAPNIITSISSPTTALRISDRGDVLWTGTFNAPTIYDNFLFDGLFWNGERLMASMDVPAGANLDSQRLINFYESPYSLDMSDNGEWAMVATNMQIPPYNFTAQPDNALLFQFTLPSQCVGDFNHSGSITVQDIFDFLAAYFSSSPSADVNNSGAVTVQDIFDFLGAYFAGCP
jgi:low density lipoprotein receptor-related protein 5/6